MLNSDIEWMKKAYEISLIAKEEAPPNPWVGCVLVKNDRIIGKGYTQKYGGDHAEVSAIKNATESPNGSTAYVTLEPCNHQGKTPPCTQALIEAGVKRVVAGVKDPDTLVNGSGLSKLREMGLEVRYGVLEDKILLSLKSYFFHRKQKRPYTILKMATSIDGKIALHNGESKWISSKEAREEVQQVRISAQAILIGAHTANYDTPRLTVRNQTVNKQPLRCIFDPKGQVEVKGPLFETDPHNTLIFTQDTCSKEVISKWNDSGVKIIILPSPIMLNDVQKKLGELGILQLLVEGGGKTFSSFFKESLWEEFHLFIGNKMLGNSSIPLFSSNEIDSVESAPTPTLCSVKQFGQTVRLIYTPSE